MIDFRVLTEKFQNKRGYCFWEPPLSKIKGIRTNCVTGAEKENELEYEIREVGWKPNSKAFFLHGGVTGYESFLLEDVDVQWMAEKGWRACAGTQNRWDSLYIPAEEMRRVFEKEGLWKS